MGANSTSDSSATAFEALALRPCRSVGRADAAAVLKMTIRVLAALPPQVPDPEVLPSTDGGVLLEWDMSGVELLLGLDDQALHTAVVSIDGSGEQEGPAVGLHDAIVDALVTLADRA